MFSICSLFEIFPASTCAGSPPTQLKRRKMSRITPKIVGIICHSRRITYAVTGCLLPHGQLLGGHVDVEVLEIGVEDRVLLVALHPRVLQMVVEAVAPETRRGKPGGQRVCSHVDTHFTP